ncbi:hypothetical protein NUSPORA_00983 [Nucleospora cyclopteri]
MDGTQGYKYLGIIENSKSEDTGETAEKIKVELLARVERLCKTKLNGKNLFRAINEHAISLVNYYINVLKIEPDGFARLNEEIRLILTKNKIHFQPSCKDRLYPPRTEMGRGLCSVEQRSEQMLLQLKTQFEKDRHRSIRRATILSVEKKKSSHLALIIPYLSNKYNIGHLEIELPILLDAQKKYLYNKIKDKTLHSKLYKCAENPLVDCEA